MENVISKYAAYLFCIAKVYLSHQITLFSFIFDNGSCILASWLWHVGVHVPACQFCLLKFKPIMTNLIK